ncbi:MAG: PAS domain-containing protein [Anaerolineales bacterium]|nr:PAS domain-containing protein [Anaerolineales bacterium]
MQQDSLSSDHAAAAALPPYAALCTAIVEEHPDSICCWAPDRTLTFANAAFARRFCRPAGALIGQDLLLLFAREARTGQAAALAAVVAALRPEAPQLTGRREQSAGDETWWAWTDRGSFDAQGALTEIVSIGRDITAQVELEEQLAHERQLQRTLFDVMPDTIYTKDLESRFVMVNQGWCANWGNVC